MSYGAIFMGQLFLITVFLPGREPFYFKVTNFKRTEGRVQFIDRVTNLPRDYPAEYCTIEGVEK